MLHPAVLNDFDAKELVYIPQGAEKGDCPYCSNGVLRRDTLVEEKYHKKEAYICAGCGMVYTEAIRRRHFKGLEVNKGLK